MEVQYSALLESTNSPYGTTCTSVVCSRKPDNEMMLFLYSEYSFYSNGTSIITYKYSTSKYVLFRAKFDSTSTIIITRTIRCAGIYQTSSHDVQSTSTKNLASSCI
jgi:hypothetical protein